MAEFEQFALDSLVAPGSILDRYTLDQHCNIVIVGQAGDSVRVRPFLGHQATMPTQYWAGCDQSVRS